MRSARSWLLLAAVCLLIAGSWKEFLSPGAVHASHSSIGGDCDQCHLVFDGIPDEKCLSCHEGVAALEAQNKGFHAAVAGQGCIECHGDHAGPTGSLTRPEAREAFDHSRTAFSLAGSHAAIECATCHKAPLRELEAVCSGCHEDPHSSALGPQCDACHGPTAWTADLKTVEAHDLDMRGKHGKALCEECHTRGEHLRIDVSCAECHTEDDHGGTTHACSDCHEVSGFKPAEFDHGPCTCAFPGKHQTVECLACHEDFVFTDSPTECSGCHVDDRPHDDLGGCAQCHTATSWSENRFVHNEQSAFKIGGEHLSVSCSQCHADGNFKGAPGACEDCHGDKGATAHGDFGACGKCHTTDGFDQSSFDHGAAGFELTGRHKQLDCRKCHEPAVEP